MSGSRYILHYILIDMVLDGVVSNTITLFFCHTSDSRDVDPVMSLDFAVCPYVCLCSKVKMSRPVTIRVGSCQACR